MVFDDGAVIHGELRIAYGHLFQEIGFANTDTGDGRGSVAAEKWLAKGNLAAIAHAHGNQFGNFVNHALLHAAGPAAMASGAAGIVPVLRESDSNGQFAFDLLGIGRAAKRAPRKTVGVHAILRRAAALALRIERK